MLLLQLVETEITTKHGQPIRLERHSDTEGDKNRGWQVDEVRAYVNGVTVGYLKMSYIPLERFKRYYPSIFNYLDQIAGWAGLYPWENRGMRWQDMTDDQLKKLIKHIEFRFHHQDYSDYDGRSKALNVDRPILEQWAARLEAQLMKSVHGEKFKGFRKTHVNKPLVDYIRVSNGKEGDTRKFVDDGIDYRKRGIGRALYMEGAQWLKEQGMVLRASSLQQPEAAAAWMSFKREGLTRKDKDGRTYLSV